LPRDSANFRAFSSRGEIPSTLQCIADRKRCGFVLTLTKIVSGGQTGVDRGALRAAMEVGLDYGGWCPPGRACEDGLIPPEFNLMETPEDRSPLTPDVPRSLRTERNVRDSDATLVLRPAEFSGRDRGTDATIAFARRYGRPLLVCDPRECACGARILKWLEAFEIRILNLAGPSERSFPGIETLAYKLIMRVLGDRLAATDPRKK